MKKYLFEVSREFYILVISMIILVFIVMGVNQNRILTQKSERLDISNELIKLSDNIDQKLIELGLDGTSQPDASEGIGIDEINDIPDKAEKIRQALREESLALLSQIDTKFLSAALRIFLLEFYKKANPGTIDFVPDREPDATDIIVLAALREAGKEDDIILYKQCLPDEMAPLESMKAPTMVGSISPLKLNKSSKIFQVIDRLKVEEDRHSPLRMMVSVAFSVMIFSVIALLISMLLTRRLGIVYMYYLSKPEKTGRFGLRLAACLPYLFIVPTFVVAAIIEIILEGQLGAPVLTFMLLILVMVISGGISFEILHKYFDEGRKEADKPYIKFLKMLKRDGDYGLSKHLSAAGLLNRRKNVVESRVLSPYILRACDFRLLPFARRRIGSLVDTYAIAGLILSYRFWGDSENSDVISALQETATSYGMNIDYIWLLAAIMIGLFMARVVFLGFESLLLGEKE